MVIGLVGGLAIVVAAFTLLHVVAAADAGRRGRSALAVAEAHLSNRDLQAARRELTVAHDSFTVTQAHIGALGPVAHVARTVPLLGSQFKALDTFAEVGVSLSGAAQGLVEAADTIVHPADERLPISEAMEALRRTQRLLGPATLTIEQASSQVERLKGGFLVGPLARTRDDLATRLPRIRDRARSADHGLTAMIAFAGGSGPKRYLFLSQNPDEVRPTGGFIGTYGVLTAEGGGMKLERYDAIENWVASHPQAIVHPEKVGPPYHYHAPPSLRTIINVNTLPDWARAAELAADLWRAGGEEPVDGVISFTPGFMGRVLSVVGPVFVASYGDVVTADNIDERLDFYTHQVDPTGTGRKDFVAVLAELVMRKLLEAPASQWEPLGRALGDAFDAREALAWSTDPQVTSVLVERGWDGALPAHRGDFFFNSEFAYAAKNGRGIRRVYDHHVAVGVDGAARVTTRLTLTNTEPPDPLGNASTLAYLTIYGPEGAVLDEAASDAFAIKEPPVAGHPGTGWFKGAAPSGGTTTLTVVWDVPGLVRRLGPGPTWEYSLRWRNLPDHTGDVVNLSIALPPSWHWEDASPPAQFSLDREMIGSWLLRSGG